mmetsp:Transcript_15133/g.16828  ORF Transcript_15133/g.16828 Transcript_15133/m.16828 type:complete len:453 (-) Transcript_15133:210-1568(-)
MSESNDESRKDLKSQIPDNREGKGEQTKPEEDGKAGKEEKSGDNIITMVDVLEGIVNFESMAQRMEKTLKATECTYDRGYVTQEIFACKTCSASDDYPAGFCLACSLHCHLDHEIFELYEKRDFRCDCGNSKMANRCQLVKPGIPERELVNEKNKYNHNFSGRYCVCDQPYNIEEDTMLMCLFCEDWFHDHHCEPKPPADDTFASMVCKSCMTGQSKFLLLYPELHAKVTIPEAQKNTSSANTTTEQKESNGGEQFEKPQPSLKASGKRTRAEMDGCLIADRDFDSEKTINFTYLKKNWIEKLCQCEACHNKYYQVAAFLFSEEAKTSANNVEGETGLVSSSVLEDPELELTKETSAPSLSTTTRDSVSTTASSSDDKKVSESESGFSVHDQGMEKFSALPQNMQMRIAGDYRELMESFKGHFSDFSKSGEVVTKQHVEKFFAELKAKKQKL